MILMNELVGKDCYQGTEYNKIYSSIFYTYLKFHYLSLSNFRVICMDNLPFLLYSSMQLDQGCFHLYPTEKENICAKHDLLNFHQFQRLTPNVCLHLFLSLSSSLQVNAGLPVILKTQWVWLSYFLLSEDSKLERNLILLLPVRTFHSTQMSNGRN